MLKNVLKNKVDGFEIDQNSGSRFSVSIQNKNLIFFKIGAVIYMLMAIFMSVVLFRAYFKGAKIYDGQEMPFWFVSVFFIAEWVPLFFILWIVFAKTIFHFDYTSFEIRIKYLWLVREKLALEKIYIDKVLLISQSDDSSVCALKIQSGDNEYTVLWMHTYEQCHWLGTVLANWSGKPLEE